MTQYLVYWKTYWQSLQDGRGETTANWSTDSESFWLNLRKNDKIWVVISGGESAPDEWRLLQKFVVVKPNPNLLITPWGKYGIIGSPKENQVFDINQQPDMTAILWMLKFSTGKRITVLGQKIGQSLQTHGHRTLSEEDVILLENYAQCISEK